MTEKENKVDKSIKVMRRSIFASCDIKKGEIIKDNKISILRPRIGIPAEQYLLLKNKKAKKDIKKNTPITWNLLN